MEQHTGSAITGPQKIKKHLFIKDLKAKDEVRSSFMVKSKDLLFNKNGKPYLAMILTDRTGEIDSRVWDGAETLSSSFSEGDVVVVGGKTHLFQSRMQLILDHIVTVPSEDAQLEDYMPTTDANLDTLYENLLERFRAVNNPWIRKLSLSLLEDPEISSRYKVCPAAKTIHHAFLGGLLVHSLQLIKIVDAIVPLYENIDRDLLVFGAAFHDFGKIYELSYQGRVGYTDEGRLVGHIAIGVTLIDRKIQTFPDFPKNLENELKHLILSHHGKLEYGSPKRPSTLEADILAQLDMLDSRINSIQTFMAAEKSEARWTAYHKAYDQYFYKSDLVLESNLS